MEDGTTKLVHLGDTWSAVAEVPLEGNVFGLAQRMKHVSATVLVNVEGTPPGSHTHGSARQAIRIADKSEIALRSESGT